MTQALPATDSTPCFQPAGRDEGPDSASARPPACVVAYQHRELGLLLLNMESVDAWRNFEPGVRAAVVQTPSSPLRGSQAVIRVVGSHEPIRLVFVGRVIPAKGLQDVVRALAEVRCERPAVLSVVGEGPDLAGALTLAARPEVSAPVDPKGRMDHTGVAQQLSQSDIMVFPSYGPERFPTVVLEAMGAGLPIITTRRWGTADWLEPDVHAVFTPARDPHALAQTIMRLAADVDLRRRMSVANPEMIRDFEPGVVAARYAATLRAMIDSAAGQPR